MSDAAEKLKPVLAALPAAVRTELIDFLVALHDEEELTDEEWEEHWAEEFNRRIADIESGRTKLIPGDEVMRQMKEKYG